MLTESVVMIKDLHEYLIGPRVASTIPHVLTGETLPAVLGKWFCIPIFPVTGKLECQI